ncbi:MAG TPA: two-component regulator propeller domain-containing protein, partial [Draconibacterium sp.]|nr:two-component regulator propeller domain-containing protein [Draconibacterium sp.]
LWLGTFAGIQQFNFDTKQFINYYLPDTARVFSILTGPDGNLWVGSGDGLYQFNTESKTFSLIPVEGSHTVQPTVNALYIDQKNVLWIGTEGDGLFKIDTKSNSYVAENYNPDNLIDLEISANAITEDKKGMLWVGTAYGLHSIDMGSNVVTTYRYDPSNPNSINGYEVQSVFIDRTGNIWVGTANGINKIPAQIKPFEIYQNRPASYSLNLANSVLSVLEDSTGVIWLRIPEGLTKLDSNLNKIDWFPSNPSGNNKETEDWVQAFYEDRKGQVWIGTQYGFQVFNRTSGTFINYPFPESYPAPLFYYSISEDPDGKLWIGGGVPISFDPVQKEYKAFYKENNSDTTNLQINASGVMASRNGDIWIFSFGRGIARLNQQTGKFSYYWKGDGISTNMLNDGEVLDMYEDKDGIIWMGTSQGGLNRFDPETETFSFITANDGLASNNIESVIADDNGNLWLGTNRGLTKYNPETGVAKIFDENDGLPNNEFIRQVKYKKNGRLFFGNLNGLVVFNPDSIKENTQLPPVYLTGVEVMGEPIPISIEALKLSHKENYLSFDFVALNYNAPEKNQYAYKLEGLDKNWNYVGTQRFASYSNLIPGHYTFKVIGSNNDGVWNEQGAGISFTINPPWWRTQIAWIFYAFVFIAGIFMFDRIMRKRAIAQERERSRQLELEHAKEIEKAYSRLEQSHESLKATQSQLIQSEKMARLGELTAGIAHEIQNPLNFVNNFSEVSKELIAEMKEEIKNKNYSEVEEISDDIDSNLEKINHHGKRAESIVKGMLLHSRGNTGQKESTDINTLADEYLRLSYHGFRAKDKSFNADFKLEADKTLPKIKVVPQDIGRVLLNLINNAFYAVNEKVKQNENSYKPLVVVQTRKSEEGIEIHVSDNGPGIPVTAVRKIFEPFFTTKPTGQGTGLGLSLSYDIVKAHGGNLNVETTEEKGTKFIISLKI